MYPHRELSRLASHKAALRRRITSHRVETVGLATRVLQPVAWLDRLLAFARRLSPFAVLAALPLGLLFKRSAAPRPRLFGTLLRWAPLVLGAVRGFAACRRR